MSRHRLEKAAEAPSGLPHFCLFFDRAELFVERRHLGLLRNPEGFPQGCQIVGTVGDPVAHLVVHAGDGCGMDEGEVKRHLRGDEEGGAGIPEPVVSRRVKQS